MFDRIASRYDLLNRVLSGGIDSLWRRSVVRELPAAAPGTLRLLDLATGTADQILGILAADDRVGSAVGVDISSGMLELGRTKLQARSLDHRVDLQLADAMTLPFAAGSFDVATMAFGIRNVVDPPCALREILRVLRPGGRVVILEFSVPRFAPVRALYLGYFRHVLPRVGGWISGDRAAYRYLNQTAETFPAGEAFCGLLREAGFSEVSHRALTLGIATIYRGDVPPTGGSPS